MTGSVNRGSSPEFLEKRDHWSARKGHNDKIYNMNTTKYSKYNLAIRGNIKEKQSYPGVKVFQK